MIPIMDYGSPCRQKEIHFWDWHRRKGLKWYSNQFPSQQQQHHHHKFQPSSNINHYYGEITPCYAVLEEKHIREIKTLFPNIKLIFLARDIVDRAWSALLMELRNAVHGLDQGVFAQSDDKLDPRELERINRESNPNKYNDEYFMDRLRHSTHSSRCDYATSTKRWLKYFTKDQLLILDYDDIAKNPRGLIERVCKHIGVNSDGVLKLLSDEKLAMRVNAAGGGARYDIRPSLRLQMVEYLKPFADDFNTLLTELGYDWELCNYSNKS